MELARFKIEPAKKQLEQVERETYAGVFFSVKQGGQELPLQRYCNSVSLNGTKLAFGSQWSREMSRNGIYLTQFGLWRARNSDENDILLAAKPQLEAAFTELANGLFGLFKQERNGDAAVDALPVGVSTKDLFTGQELAAAAASSAAPPPPPRAVAEYRFLDPEVTLDREMKERPARILFTCLLPMPVEGTARGSAGDFEVVYTTVVDVPAGLDSARGHFYFDRTGYITKDVEALRAQYADAIITAAFRDLVQNLLERNDAALSGAEAWRAETSTTFRIVD